MKEEPDAPTTGTQATAPVGAATPGGLLKQERERRGLSIQQAAEDLHLDPKLVEAIEANRFETLGAPVYAKGHLRKYATLLNLSPDVVVGRYDALGGTPEVPTPIPVSAPPPPRKRSLRVPLIVIAVVLAVGLLWWIVSMLLAPPPPIIPAPVSTGRPSDTAESLGGRTGQAIVPDSPAASAPPSVAAAARTIEPGRGAAGVIAEPKGLVPGNDLLRLRLRFSEPSWIEVYDAGGERLVYDMGTPERARSVSGAAPLKVVVGLVSAVTAEVNGQMVSIPQRAGRDGARFEIGRDGAIR